MDENAPPRSRYEARPLLFHGSVIKITRGSGRSFRSVRLAFRQPHQPIAGDDRAAWRHFHAAQRHQSGQCDRRYFPGGCPKVNFKGYFEQRSKLFRRQNRRSFDHHQMDTLDYQTTPVLRGTAKGGSLTAGLIWRTNRRHRTDTAIVRTGFTEAGFETKACAGSAYNKRPGRRPKLRRRLFQRGVDRRVGRVERCAEAIHSRDDGERNTRRDQGVFNRGGARLIRQKALKQRFQDATSW